MTHKTTLRGLLLAALLISLPGAYAAPAKTAPAKTPSAKTAPSPEKRQFAQTVCECVYDSSEQAYGSAQWLETVKQAEQQQTMDTKLQQTIQTTMQQCAQQYFAQVQAASDASAAK